MKASEYIKALQQLISEHGDCELVYWDKGMKAYLDDLDIPEVVKVKSMGDGMYESSAETIPDTVVFDTIP
jgi:hypothetical protein